MNEIYKIREWNIHKMTRNIPAEPFVISRIKQGEPDIIVLVEYKEDHMIEQALAQDYFFGVAIGKKGNDVLIAIRKEIVAEKTEPNFNQSFLKASLGEDQPTVLETTFETKDKKLISVIGLRYVQGGNGLKVSKYMKLYLDKLNHAFICTGDFNVFDFRMPIHFGDYYQENYDRRKENSSIVMLHDFKECIIKGFERFDHVVYNSNIKRNSLTYSWDFISLSDIYPSTMDVGYVWKIPVAYPDHAVLECDFSIN